MLSLTCLSWIRSSFPVGLDSPGWQLYRGSHLLQAAPLSSAHDGLMLRPLCCSCSTRWNFWNSNDYFLQIYISGSLSEGETGPWIPKEHDVLKFNCSKQKNDTSTTLRSLRILSMSLLRAFKNTSHRHKKKADIIIFIHSSTKYIQVWVHIHNTSRTKFVQVGRYCKLRWIDTKLCFSISIATNWSPALKYKKKRLRGLRDASMSGVGIHFAWLGQTGN